MALEGYALIVDLPRFGERKDLEAARIRQHGVRPLHELMQAAQVADDFIAGAQVEMIGIAED